MLLPESIDEFLGVVQEFLERAEARNSLMLGAALSLRGREVSSNTERFMAVVRKGSGVSLAALMTPPYPLILASSDEMLQGSLSSLADHLKVNAWPVSGVVADPELASGFAEEWEVVSRQRVRASIMQRIYSLESPRELALPAGRLRPATDDDAETVISWMQEFEAEALHNNDHERVAHMAVSRIAERQMYLWEAGEPRSMVGRSRPTRHTVTVNAVYTPPKWRRQGFATAAVTDLSRQLLSEGFTACVLYTDLANPTSNAIYQRIGYEAVSDSTHLTFEPLG